MKTYKTAVLGATGAVGQRFIRLLDGHPQFRLAGVVASPKNAGKPYEKAVDWFQDAPVPKAAAKLTLSKSGRDIDADVFFSALPGGEAGPTERAIAKAGGRVFTNARDLRMEADVPLVIAEVNPDHLELLDKRKGHGFVVANGNCTAITLALALKPLQDAFGLEQVHVVSMQALSGAGAPGAAGPDADANVIPHIAGEEAKVESETQRFLGAVARGRIAPARIPVSATCTRVPVAEGHTEVVSVTLSGRPTLDSIIDAFASFSGEPQRRNLASAPHPPIVVHSAEDRPQPRKDEGLGGGMALSVGRIRKDPILGWKFVCLASNTVRGAAGGSILNAELCAARGLL